MLFYAETGVQFTNDFGDIDETFYNSLAGTYHNALKIMQSDGILDNFKLRAEQMLADTRNVGWGFHDYLCDLYNAFYSD